MGPCDRVPTSARVLLGCAGAGEAVLGVEQHEQARHPVRQHQAGVVQQAPGIGPASPGQVFAAQGAT